MNTLTGTITHIQTSGAIMLVDIDVGGHAFSALLVEPATRQEWLRTGNVVYLAFKETEVSLAKGLKGKLSMRNRMMCRVESVKRGDLLSVIGLQFQGVTLASAITTRSADMLQLAVGDEIEALVKSNEISLMKIP